MSSHDDFSASPGEHALVATSLGDGARALRADHPPTRLRARYGPWAVVTGASDGIGLAIARELASEGLDIVLVARRGDVLRDLAAELSQKHGTTALVVACDLATDTGISALRAASEPLDVALLVASAGFGTAGRFVDGDLTTELAMIDVNCRAVAALTHYFGARFARQGRGGIVLLSSLVAFQGVPRAANYAATKAYVQSLAEGLGSELRPFGVDVLASAPGPIRSGFGARANMNMSMALTPDVVARQTLRALGRTSLVRPGWLSKLLELSLAMLPRWGRVKMMGLVMGGMTKHLG